MTEENEPSLVWAIRGAGRYFGLVTELVIRAHFLREFGNNKGVIWAGDFVFPLDRAKEVSSVLRALDGMMEVTQLLVL